MADLSITAANVLAASGAVIQSGTLGATGTAGQVVYLDSSTQKLRLADADLSVAAAEVVGILLNGGGDGQPIDYVLSGGVDVGATLTVGEIYVLSGTAGGIAPEADLASSDWVTVLGVATAADNLKLSIIASGAQVP